LKLQRIIDARHILRSQSALACSTSTFKSTASQTSIHEGRTMSYYFAIIGTQDNPLFEYEFGTSKQGGDGIARFPEQARHMNQFIVHSSLDIVEEVQWGAGQMYVPLPSYLSSTITNLSRYLKCIDRFYNNYVSCFITGGSQSPSLHLFKLY
jgi:hypothetical protein